ncbi:MAG TPA: glycosyltransferase family 4 protein [Burkholderiales bacterium]|nr:glycosyltransferase family 4 protein [Burkholderiales bacterium]
MRITLVTHYYPAHGGGVERIAGQLAERLARAGLAQIAWHASDCDPPPPSLPGLTCAPAKSWNVAERRLGFPYPLWTPAALRRLMHACRGADVVHLHDCLYLPNLVAFAAARLARRPVLVTQHIGHVPYRNPVLRALQSAANRLFGAWVLGGANQVVFESEAVREYFLRFVRFGSPPLVVQNGVDTDAFRPATSAARQQARASLGVPAGKPLLLFIGRFVEKKGLPVLRELTGRIAHAHWLFAGWGPLDPGSWARPNVSVVHRPGSDQLAALYHAADILVLPSVGEGFPLSVQEAMACGTPAFIGAETAAGCPQAGELLLREVAGTEDAAARWAARIEALIASPSTLEAMRPRVAAFAREHWSWERCVAVYGEVLRSCAAAR